MDLHSTSSTQSPPDSSKLPTAIATRLPPELLLDIFSIVSNPPSKNHKHYLDRNRNLKSLAAVHSAWRPAAREVLTQEVYIRGTDQEMTSGAEIERISGLLTESKVGGTKYLTFDGHLNELISKTGYAMWSQIRYVNLLTSCRNDGTTWMSDFTPFPRLQELHLERDDNGELNFLCFDSSDINLRFPFLRRITFGYGVTIRVLLRSGNIVEAKGRHLAGLLPITHKLFSPSNMPNLLHLALYASGNTLPTYLILLAKVLPQITTLAIWCNDFDIANLFPENRILDNLRHLSLDNGNNNISSLLNHGRWDLESLHLSAWSLEGDQEVISRLIKITKGEDSRHRIRRIFIYGKTTDIETVYVDLLDDLDVFEWREDSGYPPFVDFDGR